MVKAPQANLSKAMRQLNGVYTQAFNRRHGRIGHVLQGRFKAITVDRESYLPELCRDVVLNPVRTKTTRKADSYPWSSYDATAAISGVPPFLTVDWLLSQFGKQRAAAQRKYRAFVAEGIGRRSPWEQLQGQILLGSERFVARVTPGLRDKRPLKEIPRRQRSAGRPTLVHRFSSRSRTDRTRRNKTICHAHLEHGYSLTEIGRTVGLHYSTISRIVNCEERKWGMA